MNFSHEVFSVLILTSIAFLLLLSIVAYHNKPMKFELIYPGNLSNMDITCSNLAIQSIWHDKVKFTVIYQLFIFVYYLGILVE